MSRKCTQGCTCGRHTADHPNTGPRFTTRKDVDIARLRELAPHLTQEQLAIELNSTRKVIQHRMKELGISGRPQSMTWAAKHKRLRKVRGKASAHQCVRCPTSARDWAQVHTEDGTDPWADYVPLCRACHIHYDRDSRYNPDALSRWRASAGPAIAAAWTPERREAQSARARAARLRRPTARDPRTGRFV